MADWLEALGNMRVQFWVCPIRAHGERKDDRGEPVVTVKWRGDIAYCTAPGCGHTSAASSTEEEKARHASPHCACGVNDAGQSFVDPICRRSTP